MPDAAPAIATGMPLITSGPSDNNWIVGACSVILAGVITMLLAPQVIVILVPTVVDCAKPIIVV